MGFYEPKWVLAAENECELSKTAGFGSKMGGCARKWFVTVEQTVVVGYDWEWAGRRGS
jgi:hypothetical protein